MILDWQLKYSIKVSAKKLFVELLTTLHQKFLKTQMATVTKLITGLLELFSIQCFVVDPLLSQLKSNRHTRRLKSAILVFLRVLKLILWLKALSETA